VQVRGLLTSLFTTPPLSPWVEILGLHPFTSLPSQGGEEWFVYANAGCACRGRMVVPVVGRPGKGPGSWMVQMGASSGAGVGG
jgi:hypothetical protein